jgi:hypothetical protein
VPNPRLDKGSTIFIATVENGKKVTKYVLVCRSWNEANNLHKIFTDVNGTECVCITRYSLCIIMGTLGYWN